jgi:hypothetical protein
MPTQFADMQDVAEARLVAYAAPLAGTTTNDNAAAGNVGEYTSATVATSAVTLTSGSGTFAIASIGLTAGDFDVSGVLGFIPGAAGVPSSLSVMLNTTPVAPPLGDTNRTTMQLTFATGAAQGLAVGPFRMSLAAPATAFLLANAVFTGAMTAGGTIRARRVR